MPRSNTYKNRKLSKKKQKQYDKRNKLSKLSKVSNEINEHTNYQDLRKYYIAIALMNISQMLYEQGDLTWGGIVDPYTFEVNAEYWPNTDIKINDYDISRINAITSTLFTNDNTWDYQYMKSIVKK